MENKKEILEHVGNGITEMTNKMSKIRMIANQRAKMDIIKKYLDANKEDDNFEYLSKLDLDDVRELLPDSYDKDLYNLKFYIKILNTSYSSLLGKTDVKTEIRRILNSIFKEIGVTGGNHDYARVLTMVEDYKKSLETIYSKIESDKTNFTNDEIKYLIGIIENVANEDRRIELLIDISESTLDNVEVKEEKEEKIDELEKVETVKVVKVKPVKEKVKVKPETTNGDEIEEILTENEDITLATKEIKEVFEKYELDFDEFISKQTKATEEEFLKYAKASNIESILETLSKYNISLNDRQETFKILKSKAKQLRDVFLYSNSETITKVFDVVRREGLIKTGIRDKYGKTKTGIMLDLLLEVPARLIEKKRRIKLSDKPVDYRTTNETVGAAEDFINNIYLLKEYGVPAFDVCKNGKVSIRPTEKIKQAIKVFELYGISKERYTSKLSCLDATHQADALDMFIELGRYDYVSKNVSRTHLFADDPIFYRLLYALKYTTLTLDRIFTYSGNLTALIHGQTKAEKDRDDFGITVKNKEAKVNQTKKFYGNEELAKEYDSVIDPLASDIEVALSDPDSIIHILDKNFLGVDQFGKEIYPKVYDFGEADATNMRGKWELLISRNKVLRLCNELMLNGYKINNMDTIMYVLTKNSILTEEEFKKIKDAITNVLRKDDEKNDRISK